MGRNAEIIFKLYQAYRRQDLDELVEGMHPLAEFKPVPSARVYRGRDDIRLLFEYEIHQLREFDFRVVTVQERSDLALLFGRCRIWEGEELGDRGIFWLARVRDDLLAKFEPFEDIAEAISRFSSQTASG